MGNGAHAVILLAGIALAPLLCRFLGLSQDLLHDGARGVALVIGAMVLANTAATLEVPVYATGRMSGIQGMAALGPWVRLILLVLAFQLFVPSLTVYGGVLVLAEIPALFGLAFLAQRARTAGPAIPRPDLGDAAIRREQWGKK